MLIHRSINLLDADNHIVKSTLALEPIFWEAIDEVFGKNWRHWAIEQLQNKPDLVSNSSFLRQAIMKIQRAEKPLNITYKPNPLLARLHSTVKTNMVTA